VTLAAFNLLPIPPLDGSAVVTRLLPPAALPTWYSLTRYAMPVFVVLVLAKPGAVGHVLGPAEVAFARLVS
jgi:Zn-dependent protease